MPGRGQNTSWMNKEYPRYNEHNDLRIRLQGETVKRVNTNNNIIYINITLHIDRRWWIVENLVQNSSIGLYRENAIAIQNESGDSNGGNV